MTADAAGLPAHEARDEAEPAARGVAEVAAEQGEAQSEVLIALPDGQMLCATVPNAQVEDMQEQQQVTAYFNADRVILATLC